MTQAAQRSPMGECCHYGGDKPDSYQRNSHVDRRLMQVFAPSLCVSHGIRFGFVIAHPPEKLVFVGFVLITSGACWSIPAES